MKDEQGSVGGLRGVVDAYKRAMTEGVTTMLHNVLNSGLLTDTTIPFAIARVATGSFFALSGFHKLFNRARHGTLVDTLKACGVPCVPIMQWFVPSVELSAGLGLAFGFLTPLAALGLIAICVVATCTDGLKRIKSWQPLDRADAVDDLLYLPEFIYVILLSFFVAAGAGPLSLDAIISGYL